jgi:hypothetical protein
MLARRPLVMEPALGSPTTTRTPQPANRGLDLVPSGGNLRTLPVLGDWRSIIPWAPKLVVTCASSSDPARGARASIVRLNEMDPPGEVGPRAFGACPERRRSGTHVARGARIRILLRPVGGPASRIGTRRKRDPEPRGARPSPAARLQRVHPQYLDLPGLGRWRPDVGCGAPSEDTPFS